MAGHGRLARSLQVWCLAYLCLLGAQAEQVQVNFQMSNNIASWLVSDYGLEVGGSITMELTNSQPANDTYVLILTRGQLLEWRDADDNLVILTPLNDKAPRPLNSFLVSAWRSNLRDHLQGTFRAEEATGGRNRYNVVIMSATKSPLHIRGKLTLENPNGQQLSIQDVYVPKTLVVAANIYLMTAVFTALGLITRPRSGRNALHCLALTVIFLRGVSLLLRWLDYRIIATTGVESSAVDITWKLLSKVQNILELMAFLLISLGWKVLRSSLDVSEIRFAVAVSIISFYLGVFQVACTTQATCSGYQLSRYILHSLCFLVVIVAMNFNLQKLASAISEAPATVESGKLYRKLSAYYIFRWVFLGFIIAPTVELFLKVTVVPWDAQWLYIAIQELRTWVIYALLIYAFRMAASSSDGTSMIWAAFAVAAAAIGYGSYYVPVRKYDVYDGLVYQWFFCCGILIGALVAAVARNDWRAESMSSSAFYVAPHGLLSGLLWSVANVWATRAVQYFGIGNYYIWHELTNLFGTFVIGVFGPSLGIPARPPRVEWLAGLGFICVFLGMIPVVFMRDKKEASSNSAASPPTETTSLETLFRQELQEGSGSTSPNHTWTLPEVLQVAQESFAAANALTWDGTIGRPDVQQLRRLRFASDPLKLDSLGCSGGLPIAASPIVEEAEPVPSAGRAWLKGWLLSLVTGLVLSLQYEPMLPWKQSLEARGFKPSGVDYAFSNCLGIFLCSTAYLLIAGGWKRLTRQPLQKPVLRPALLAGVMWTLASYFQLYAMTQLPYAVAYCLIVGGGLAVSLLWGTLLFGEAEGLHNKKCLALAFLGVFVGLVLLGIAA